MQWREATGATILEGYGMTEAGPVLSYNPQVGPAQGRLGSAVRSPAASCRSSRRRPAGRSAPARVGEIRVRGPHVMAGYRNRPALTAESLRDGWFHTGDLGRLDADGYLYIRGRRSDVINVGGYNVYPREVEQLLLEHPEVAEAAVFGAADDYYGQVVQAYVVPRPGSAVAPQELLDHCGAGLVRYKIPRALRLVAELPKTSVGKLARGALAPIAPSQGDTTGR